MQYRVGLCLLFFLSYPIASIAQATETNEEVAEEIIAISSLSVRDVVDAAMEITPGRMVSRSKERNAEALAKQASSFFSDTPEISFKMQNDSVFTNQGLREWESALEMPLWMPGQRSASKLKSRMSEQEASAFENLVLLQVTGQVRELLWELELAELEVTESRRNLELAQALKDDIDRRIAAGNLPRRDAIMGQKEVMTQRMNVINAEAEYIHVIKEYESVTGLQQRPEFIEEIVAHESELPLQEANIENSPILKLANAKVEYLRAEYKVAKNSWSSPPRLSLGFKNERGTFMDRSINSLGVGISVPLGAGVHMTSKRAAAALTVAEAERERELIKRELKLAYHEAEHELEVCEVQLPLTKSHFSLETENFRLSQKAFDLGESDLLDLLKAQEQFFLSSRLNSIRIIECGRAIARHNQTLGVLLP